MWDCSITCGWPSRVRSYIRQRFELVLSNNEYGCFLVSTVILLRQSCECDTVETYDGIIMVILDLMQAACKGSDTKRAGVGES